MQGDTILGLPCPEMEEGTPTLSGRIELPLNADAPTYGPVSVALFPTVHVTKRDTTLRQCKRGSHFLTYALLHRYIATPSHACRSRDTPSSM